MSFSRLYSIALQHECTSCLQNQTLDQYEGNYSRNCQHSQRTICNQCVYNHSRFTLENGATIKVICPEPGCRSTFSYQNIRRILAIGNNRRLLDQYDLAVTRKCLEEIPEFIWCAHPGCQSGQIHDMSMYTGCKMTCIECNRDTCSFHRTIWHTGMTCERYDRRGPTATWIRINTKQCPQCHRNIQKSDGCDHMTCSQCGHQFCWECLANSIEIMRIGRHRHACTCTHYRPALPDRRIAASNRSMFTRQERTCIIL